MERAGEIFHTHTSAHALTLSLTYVKLSFPLFLFLTVFLSARSVLNHLSLVLYYKHVYTLSLSPLLTLTVAAPSSSFLPLSSLICVCLMPCQSEQHHQHTERFRERQGGRQDETDPWRRRRHKKAEDIWSLVANSFTDDKWAILCLLMGERGGDKQ